MDNDYNNGSGYPDPTAYEAICRADAERLRLDRARKGAYRPATPKDKEKMRRRSDGTRFWSKEIGSGHMD